MYSLGQVIAWQVGRPGLGRNVAVSRISPFIGHGGTDDMGWRQCGSMCPVSVEALIQNDAKWGKACDHLFALCGNSQ